MKKIIALLLALVLTLTCFAGCGKEKEETGEIVITYPTYRVGTHLSAGSEKAIIDGFNKEFAGKYRVEIEELPGDDAYVDKMKVLAGSNSLPDVVEGKNGVLELAIKNGQAIDLNAMVNADAQFKKEIGENAIKANTIDGKLYSISNGNQLIGYFYNKEHYKDAGIKPATTWDEFMSNLEALKGAGHTPISMMTADNCWTTNLLLGAMVGTDGKAGNTFMTTKYAKNYETAEFKDAIGMIQSIMKNYTTPDAIGANYDIAANHFLQGNTSIIVNGPWMTGDFSGDKAVAGLADDIGVAMFPGSGAFATYEIGYLVCADTPEKQEAAFEFVKYKTNAAAQEIMLEEGTVPLTNLVELSDEYKKENGLVAEIIEKGGVVDYQFNTIDYISYANVVTEFSKNYPALADGGLTVDQFCKKLTEAAAKNKD